MRDEMSHFYQRHAPLRLSLVPTKLPRPWGWELPHAKNNAPPLHRLPSRTPGTQLQGNRLQETLRRVPEEKGKTIQHQTKKGKEEMNGTLLFRLQSATGKSRELVEIMR